MGQMFSKAVKNDEELAKLFEVRLPAVNACYAYYPNFWNGKVTENEQMYMGFFATEEIEKLIEEVNNKFTNIKIRVALKKKLPCSITAAKFNQTTQRIQTEHVKQCNFYAFNVQLSPEYSQKSNYVLTLVMTQFLRMFCPEYAHFVHGREIKEKFILNTLKGFYKSHDSYGNWTHIECNMELFDKFDDIKLVNESTKDTYLESMPYVSSFLKNLKLALGWKLKADEERY